MEHLEAIAHRPSGSVLTIDQAGVEDDKGDADLGKPFIEAGATRVSVRDTNMGTLANDRFGNTALERVFYKYSNRRRAL